tara:strand:- start:3367 stop:4725 length:1359 start_codon:yes stop_codon:yes gene_type:complete
MSSDWKTLTLNEIVNFGNGKARPKTEGNIPIYGGNGVLGYSGDSNYQDETIIIGRVGAYCGATYFENNPIWVSDNALSAKAKEGFLAKYAYYVLKSKNLNQYAQGSSHPLLTQGLLNKLEAYVTTNVQIQEKIVSIIGDIEDKIAVNTQTNQTLEQIAQAIFKSWFIDFDPVKAKIEALAAGGSDDDAELAAMSVISAKTLDELKSLKASNPEAFNKLAQTAALFPAAMQDSELGEIPEGWNATPFGELLEKTIGGDWGKEALDEKHTKKVRILRGTDLPNVHSGNDSGVPVRYVNKKKLQTRQLQDGDIVIEVSGGSPTQPTGRSLFISQKILDGLKEPAEPASFCRLFRPLNVKLGLLLSCHLTKIYSDGKTWLYQNQSTGISNFQTKVFLEKELVVDPDAGVLDAFIHNIRPFFDRIHSGESKKLSALRDTLLPELLSGNCPISTVEEV